MHICKGHQRKRTRHRRVQVGGEIPHPSSPILHIQKISGLDTHENQLLDQECELTSPGSQSGDRQHDRGSGR